MIKTLLFLLLFGLIGFNLFYDHNLKNICEEKGFEKGLTETYFNGFFEEKYVECCKIVQQPSKLIKECEVFLE